MHEPTNPIGSIANPLPPTNAVRPYYVVLPIKIWILNLESGGLAKWLQEHPPVDDGNGNAMLTIDPAADGTEASEPAESNEDVITGTGTAEDPFSTHGTLYALAPVVFVFVGVSAAELKVTATKVSLSAKKEE